MPKKTLIIGDPHLGKGSSLGRTPPGGIYNSRHLDQINLLSWIVVQALLHDVGMIILTGDIFEDAKPDYHLVQAFLSFLCELSNNDIEVHVIVGNHDLKRVGKNYYSILEILDTINIDNVFLHKEFCLIKDENIEYILMPFMDRRYFEAESQEIAQRHIHEKIQSQISKSSKDSIKIGVGHLVLEGSLYVGDELDDLTNEIFCPLSFFHNFDYVWMGHIHKPQILQKKPYLAHIGSLDLSNFAEYGQKKILILIDPETEKFYQEIPIPTRPLRHFSLEIPDPINNFLHDYSTKFVINFLEKENLEKAILRLEIKLNPQCPPLFRSEIEEFLYTKNIHYLASFSETRKNIVVKQTKTTLNNDVGPLKAVQIWAEEKLSEEDRSEYIQFMSNIIKEVLIKK